MGWKKETMCSIATSRQVNPKLKWVADPTLFTGIRDILDQLNERPRKVLDWDCPKNAFKKLVGALET
jgi:IS30 family transposase